MDHPSWMETSGLGGKVDLARVVAVLHPPQRKYKDITYTWGCGCDGYRCLSKSSNLRPQCSDTGTSRQPRLNFAHESQND